MNPSPTTAQITLLEGSRDFFPALIQAMDGAQHEIHLETYIFDFHGAAAEVAQALERAARRGVPTCVVVDGVGTPDVPLAWQQRLAQAGVQWQTFEPVAPLGLLIPSRWRRLHRKLCVVDGEVAFCGGINVLDDFYEGHEKATLRQPRLDFAVRLKGPLVADVRHTMRQLWWRIQAVRDWRESKLSNRLTSQATGKSYDPMTPKHFSFNSPYGACENCDGLGTKFEVDPELVIPDPSMSLRDGALAPWRSAHTQYFHRMLVALAEQEDIDIDKPWSKVSAKHQKLVLHGQAGAMQVKCDFQRSMVASMSRELKGDW